MLSKLRGTVLVVDDDPSVMRALRRQLLALGFKVTVFDSAEAFLAAETPARDVCLLLDVYLPGMSGIELCKELAALGRRIPIILMTAREDQVMQEAAREPGVIAVLYKPFEEDVLLNAVRQALRRK
jgi:FixJ family two-component response regulator